MKTIYLIDGYNLIYRLFYAVPPFTTRAGEPVNAVFGMAKTLLGIHEYERPDELYFIMDSKGKSFREEIYPEYKGTRDRMPDDLRAQESKILELLSRMEIPILSKDGYEADDLIGTLVTRLRTDPESRIYILSGDKDLYQFIGGNVMVYDTMKRKIAGREEAIEKFGVPPERVVDYLSITGDASDNIPGIPGFGPKKAQTLISEFGSLEDIYGALDSGAATLTDKTKAVLEEHRETAFLSKRLATIPTDVAFELEPNGRYKFSSRHILTPEVLDFFRTLEFKSLLSFEESALGAFKDLDIQYTEIEDSSGVELLKARIIAEKECSIGTISKGKTLT